jgi:hypothetical protein
MRQAGLAVELLETRHVHTALETMPVKSDRNDAGGIAADAVGLVPPGALQVDGRAGDVRAAHRANCCRQNFMISS